MVETKVPVLLISGPVGVGKSTVGEEISEMLEDRGTPHTFIDLDQLRYTYPRAKDDQWGMKLGLKNLAGVWNNCAAAGSLNLVVSSVVENWGFIDDISQVIPRNHIFTIQLSAGIETLQQRVKKRELGAGLDWHLKRTVELERILKGDEAPCDYRVDTEVRDIHEIAAQIVNLIPWRLE